MTSRTIPKPGEPGEAAPAAFRAVISGRVQGVGFRHFVHQRAVALGIRGRVFNRPDGAVEVHAGADRARLDMFVGELRRGPVLSRVDRLELDWNVPAPEGEDFRVTYG